MLTRGPALRVPRVRLQFTFLLSGSMVYDIIWMPRHPDQNWFIRLITILILILKVRATIPLLCPLPNALGMTCDPRVCGRFLPRSRLRPRSVNVVRPSPALAFAETTCLVRLVSPLVHYCVLGPVDIICAPVSSVVHAWGLYFPQWWAGRLPERRRPARGPQAVYHPPRAPHASPRARACPPSGPGRIPIRLIPIFLPSGGLNVAINVDSVYYLCKVEAPGNTLQFGKAIRYSSFPELGSTEQMLISPPTSRGTRGCFL